MGTAHRAVVTGRVITFEKIISDGGATHLRLDVSVNDPLGRPDPPTIYDCRVTGIKVDDILTQMKVGRIIKLAGDLDFELRGFKEPRPSGNPIRVVKWRPRLIAKHAPDFIDPPLSVAGADEFRALMGTTHTLVLAGNVRDYAVLKHRDRGLPYVRLVLAVDNFRKKSAGGRHVANFFTCIISGNAGAYHQQWMKHMYTGRLVSLTGIPKFVSVGAKGTKPGSAGPTPLFKPELFTRENPIYLDAFDESKLQEQAPEAAAR